MAMPDSEISRLGKEEYAIYTGQGSGVFSPGLAGITRPDPGYEIRRRHAGFYVFEYVIDGRGQVRQDRECLSMEGGDAYILTPGKLHHYYSDPHEPWTKVWFNVNGSMVRHLLSDYGLDGIIKIPGLHDGTFLFSIMKTIQKEPVHCRNELALLLHRYLIFLSDFLGRRTLGDSRPRAMKNFIEQNLTVPVSVDDIADSVHLSRSRCIHLFRETYHVTPYSYYQSQRLELAQSMLRQTALSIQEISERLGFTDYHHFSGFFKKGCGLSPNQYRKQQP